MTHQALDHAWRNTGRGKTGRERMPRDVEHDIWTETSPLAGRWERPLEIRERLAPEREDPITVARQCLDLPNGPGLDGNAARPLRRRVAERHPIVHEHAEKAHGEYRPPIPASPIPRGASP